MNQTKMGNNHVSSPVDSCWKTLATHNAPDNAISMKHNRLKPTKCLIKQNCSTTNNSKSQQQNADTVYVSGTPKRNSRQLSNVNKQYERTHDLVISEFVFVPTTKKNNSNQLRTNKPSNPLNMASKINCKTMIINRMSNCCVFVHVI